MKSFSALSCFASTSQHSSESIGPNLVFERARVYVSKICGAIEGNHGESQTLAVANTLVWDFALSPTEALIILREYNSRCSPPWTESELIRKLQSAEKQPHSKPRGNLRADKSSLHQITHWKASTLCRPQNNPISAVESFLKGFCCSEVDLWEASPIRPPENWTEDGLCILECLYRKGEHINYVNTFKQNVKKDGTIKANPNGHGTTIERDQLISQWRKQGMPQSAAGGWLRMNPLDTKGVADANVTSFRFALLESDKLSFDVAVALFCKLPLPIAAIITSGGRGPHAWVRVDAEDQTDYQKTVDEITFLLSRLGLDTANTNPSRLSRLPGVVRHIGASGDGRQRLLYLNPSPTQRPIW